jgi:hypothetical protein
MSEKYLSTYHLYPNDEKQIKGTPFWENNSMSIIDYLNFLIFCGGGAFLFFYFLDSFDSYGYILIVFGIIIVCEIFVT